MYAHLFVRGSRIEIVLTETPSLSDGILQTLSFANRNMAKRFCRTIGAMPWNFAA
jgi:hypothetical protein